MVPLTPPEATHTMALWLVRGQPRKGESERLSCETCQWPWEGNREAERIHSWQCSALATSKIARIFMDLCHCSHSPSAAICGWWACAWPLSKPPKQSQMCAWPFSSALQLKLLSTCCFRLPMPSPQGNLRYICTAGRGRLWERQNSFV